MEGKETETRIAVIGIIIEMPDAASQVNEILHRYGSYIIGRMGLPYPSRRINIISVALDAPEAVISALAERLDAINHVRASVAYSDAE